MNVFAYGSAWFVIQYLRTMARMIRRKQISDAEEACRIFEAAAGLIEELVLASKKETATKPA